MNNFYVYAHINPVTNKFFYIGKGFNYRCYNKQGRNKFWHNTVNKYGFAVVKLVEWLTHDQAMEIEMQYIKKYGLRSEGGCLVNLTYGGEGVPGFKLTDEMKAKIGSCQIGRVKSDEEKQKLRIANTGLVRSDEVRKKISVGHIGIKPTDETRLKLTASKTGTKNPNFGRAWKVLIPRTEEYRLRMSAQKTGVKQTEEVKAKSLVALEKARVAQREKMFKVRCLLTGTVWINKWDCIESLGIKESKFKDMTRGGKGRGTQKLEYLKI